VINGVVAPPLLVLIVLLGADQKVMKQQVSGKLSLTLTWITTALMGIAAVAMIVSLLLGG
jgi:Mn2+/Fe2+ NRAMP family transporter